MTHEIRDPVRISPTRLACLPNKSEHQEYGPHDLLGRPSVVL